MGSIVEDRAGEPISSVGDEMVAIYEFEFLADLLEGVPLLVEKLDLMAYFGIDVGCGGHQADAVVVLAEGYFRAVQTSDDAEQH